MKKVLSMILTASMAALLLAGCGGAENAPAAAPSAQPASSAPSGQTDQSASGEKTLAPGSFDEFVRPKVVEDGKLRVAYIHTKPSVESQSRSLYQAGIEAAHRGWEFIDMTYNEDTEWSDYMKNAISQGVDAIILGSTESMESKTDLVAQARNAGIGVYSNDNMVVPGVIMNSTMPNGYAAMDLIYTIGEDVGWDANVGIITVPSIQVHVERTDPISAICGVYTNMEVLDTQDGESGAGSPDANAFEIAKTWFQKYGKEINGVVASCDFIGMPVAEAATQSGDLVSPDFWVAGIDGGSTAWTYIRNGGHFKYNYAQPFEMFTHKVFEAIDQIQVQGLNPGDDGCLLSRVGEVIYSEGRVVTPENVPEPGQSIHAAFDYYGGDPDDPDAWYNWTENGGAFIIGSGDE